MANNGNSSGNMQSKLLSGWDSDRWAAVLVLGALGLLILIRMGFRGVDVLGARVSVG